MDKNKLLIQKRKQILPSFNSKKTTSINQSKNDIIVELDNKREDILDKILKLLEKKVKNINDIHIIANYLSTLYEFSLFIKETHKDAYQDLLVQIACSLKSISYKKNDIIFRYGIYLKLSQRRTRKYLLHYSMRNRIRNKTKRTNN